MLGNKQRETLQRYADALKTGEPMEIRILILPWRSFSREAGGGSGYRIMLRLVYLADGEIDFRDWLATCQEPASAEAKGVEIARYLRYTLLVEPERIRLSWGR